MVAMWNSDVSITSGHFNRTRVATSSTAAAVATRITTRIPGPRRCQANIISKARALRPRIMPMSEVQRSVRCRTIDSAANACRTGPDAMLPLGTLKRSPSSRAVAPTMNFLSFSFASVAASPRKRRLVGQAFGRKPDRVPAAVYFATILSRWDCLRPRLWRSRDQWRQRPRRIVRASLRPEDQLPLLERLPALQLCRCRRGLERRLPAERRPIADIRWRRHTPVPGGDLQADFGVAFPLSYRAPDNERRRRDSCLLCRAPSNSAPSAPRRTAFSSQPLSCAHLVCTAVAASLPKFNPASSSQSLDP
jgi:hypothetical protein